MERDCEECSSWEQSIYWTHFQSLHFCQILGSDFRSQLMIPKKFSDHAKGKLQDKVTLKGPSGTPTWGVGLATDGDMLFLRGGWTEFVNAFALVENDILIFKYNGDSSFSILVFDQGSLCEKESSYFIKKCGHSRPTKRNQEKGFLKEILEEFAQEYTHDEFASTPSKKPRKDKDDQNTLSAGLHIASDVPEMTRMEDPFVDVELAEERSRNLQKSSIWKPMNLSPEQCLGSDVPGISHMGAPCIDVEASEEMPAGNHQQESWSWEPVNLPPAPNKGKPPTKVPSINVAAHGSIMKVSEQQKETTLRMARKELTPESFLAIMRPTSVTRAFYLNIPAAWMSRNLTFKTQVVQLRTNEKTWQTKLKCRPNGRAGLSVGWKEFAHDNCLKESDVCVFKLASQKHEPVILNVSIFRVVPVAVRSKQEVPAARNKIVHSEVGMP